jgi:hypothetical protein
MALNSNGNQLPHEVSKETDLQNGKTDGRKATATLMAWGAWRATAPV